MSIISKETFDKFTKEEKAWVIKEYNSDAGEGHSMLGKLFGKENLQPKPEIKTWKDVEFSINEHYCKLDLALGTVFPTSKDDKLRLKIKATYKIAKLIELGYGGMVTEEEWKEDGNNKGFWSLWANSEGEIECTIAYDSIEFIAFHSKQQAVEFFSYPENVELVEQYYMI